MNMLDVKCFMKAAELKSFTKAANALYITQQAVSMHIRRLEDTYNVKLFERKPSLKLTPAGELFLEAASAIIERENRLIEQLSTSSSALHGEIAIGLPPNLSTAFISEFLPFFSDKYPNMQVRLVEKKSTDLARSIRDNEVDLALPIIHHASQIFDPDMFHVIHLEDNDYYAVVSDILMEQVYGEEYLNYKQRFFNGVSLTDIAGFPMFLHPENSALHGTIVSKIKNAGMNPFIRVKTSLTSSIVSLCTQGYGIFFSMPMILKYLYNSQPYYFSALNEFPVEELKGMRESVLLYHQQKLLTQPLLDSISIIRQLYDEHKNIMSTLLEASCLILPE